MITRYILRTRIKTALLVLISATFLTVYITQKCFITKIGTATNVSEYPIIVWWTPFMLETKKLINCENRFHCILTKNRSYTTHSNLAGYLFYGSSFDQNDLPLPKNSTPWAIFHEESPKNLPFFLYNDGQRLFNITSTFSRNSDFPVPLQFLKKLDQISDMTYYVPLLQKNKLLNKIAPVLYIQSDCDTPSERDNIVKELMKYINVDSYGACLNNKKLPEKYGIERTLEDLYEEDFMKFVSQYKFTIAIENAICHDYITEKLWRPLIAGSVPIYLGSPSIKDWLPNNHSAILIQDYKSIPILASYIAKVNAKDDLYEKYMQHKPIKSDAKITNELLQSMLQKGFYGIENNDDFPIPAFECFVCKTVHDKLYKLRMKSVYDCEEPYSRFGNTENWWKTHWTIGKCHAKTLHYFVEVLKLHNFTKEMFHEQFKQHLNDNNC